MTTKHSLHIDVNCIRKIQALRTEQGREWKRRIN